jgi:GNAT superfamily N-acetyltransferase
VIRPATEADARTIAELEVRAWRWAYVDFVAEEEMITVAERVARWSERPLDGAVVAEVEGRVVGVVQIGPSPDAPGIGLLRGLYVDPAAQGAGLGTSLYDFACERLRAAGYAEAVLWVFEGNGHARGFYERRGWVADGARGEAAGASELRYRQNLAAC